MIFTSAGGGMVDTLVLGTSGASRGGSSPLSRTIKDKFKKQIPNHMGIFLYLLTVKPLHATALYFRNFLFFVTTLKLSVATFFYQKRRDKSRLYLTSYSPLFP